MAETEYNPGPVSILDAMNEGFRRAVIACSEEHREFRLTLADQPVKLSVVGSELASRLVRPFAHLIDDEAAGEEARLRVEVWDRHVAGIGIEVRPESGGVDPEQRAGFERDGQVTVHRHRGSTLCLDRAGARLVGCFSRAEDLSLFERGRPFHAPLTLWHNALDVPIVHAGLVARNGKGVLFAGPAGAGKSTCAVTCILSGFTYLSDDLIGLQSENDGGFRGHSVYSSTFLDRDHAGRFPLLAGHAMESRYDDEEKLLVLLSEVLPARLGRSAPIDVVVLPELGDGARSTFRPASSATALMALAPPSLRVNRSLGARGFDKLGRLVESVPAYHLLLGSDLTGIPPAVEELLGEVG